jgi:N-methylhydantoinase A
MAYVDPGGALRVGPESAGANPGPACYGKGGLSPTVTDANVVLGRLPSTTRLAGGLALDPAAALDAVASLGKRLNLDTRDTARGIVAVANQHMAQALRLISLERGHDPRRFTLVCFGGAGGLHVCALAAALEIPRIVIPAHAGVFSALGMVVADPGRQLSRTLNLPFDAEHEAAISAGLATLAADGRTELGAEHHAVDQIVATASVDLRYRGQSYTLTLPWQNRTATLAAFHAEHEARYGHAFDLPVELVNVRTELRVRQRALELPRRRRHDATPLAETHVVEMGAVGVGKREQLATGQRYEGPLVVLDDIATTFVDPGWSVTVDEWGNLLLMNGRRSAA